MLREIRIDDQENSIHSDITKDSKKKSCSCTVGLILASVAILLLGASVTWLMIDAVDSNASGIRNGGAAMSRDGGPAGPRVSSSPMFGGEANAGFGQKKNNPDETKDMGAGDKEFLATDKVDENVVTEPEQEPEQEKSNGKKEEEARKAAAEHQKKAQHATAEPEPQTAQPEKKTGKKTQDTTAAPAPAKDEPAAAKAVAKPEEVNQKAVAKPEQVNIGLLNALKIATVSVASVLAAGLGWLSGIILKSIPAVNSTMEKVNSTVNSTMGKVSSAVSASMKNMKKQWQKNGNVTAVMTWMKNKTNELRFEPVDEFLYTIGKISLPANISDIAGTDPESRNSSNQEETLFDALVRLEERLTAKKLCELSDQALNFRPLCAVQYLAKRKKIIGEKYHKIEPNATSIPVSGQQESTQLHKTVLAMEWQTTPNATMSHTGNLNHTPKEKLQEILAGIQLQLMGGKGPTGEEVIGSGSCGPGDMKGIPNIAKKQCYMPSGMGLNTEIHWDGKKFIDTCIFSAPLESGSSSMHASALAEGHCFRMDMDSMPMVEEGQAEEERSEEEKQEENIEEAQENRGMSLRPQSASRKSPAAVLTPELSSGQKLLGPKKSQ